MKNLINPKNTNLYEMQDMLGATKIFCIFLLIEIAMLLITIHINNLSHDLQNKTIDVYISQGAELEKHIKWAHETIDKSIRINNELVRQIRSKKDSF